jgi:hypothetical protein
MRQRIYDWRKEFYNVAVAAVAEHMLNVKAENIDGEIKLALSKRGYAFWKYPDAQACALLIAN